MRRRPLASLATLLVAVALCPIVPAAQAAEPAPVGQGFNLNRSDLRFILEQIKIAEEHARTATAENPCGTQLGTGADQIPATGAGPDLPWGLRTVDGSCNNLYEGRENWGAADELFPRMVPANPREAESFDPDGPGPAGLVPTSYKGTDGMVVDTRPRMVSNVIVDQTVGNPAAVAAAGEAPAMEGETLLIPNVAPDVGLSAPYNSVFTLFGQFFDHGLDLVTKGPGIVYMPLDVNDPLYDADSDTNFMILSRATPTVVDGEVQHSNTTTAYVDQNQTYTSHPSHQVFLREFVLNAAGDPVETGRLITGPGGGMATWADVKQQARTMLGINLTDTDILNVPLLATDPYGNFIRGGNGFPKLVTTAGEIEGDPGANGGLGISTAGAVRTGHAFLDDIAHHAVPKGDPDPTDRLRENVPLTADTEDPLRAPTADDGLFTTYDDEMLNAHFIAGDGRVNENIGLTSVHHVFHAEHNRLVEDIKKVLVNEDPTMLPEWQTAPAGETTPEVWDGDRLFQAARFVTEMEYQHLVFEEFARKVQPMVNAFGEGGTGYNADVNASIRAEFAHAVYRFGHSMLTETVARTDADGNRHDVPLLDVFLNPPAFFDGQTTPDADAAAGSVIRGMSRQVGNEIDEFVTEALRNNLLGLPLDLATINIARARDTGIPTLNEARRAFYAESSNSALAPYESWADLSFSLKHPESLVNFIAAYGKHPTITGTITARRDAADALVHGLDGADGVPATADDNALESVPADRYAFLNGTDHDPATTTDPAGDWRNVGGVTTTGVDDIDLWVGGLAEKQMVFGGLLGPTFNYVFEKQMEDLQDGDRFYYLSRTAGLNLLTQLEGNSFAEMVMRNTDVHSLPADTFARPDLVFEVSKLGTSGEVTDDLATTEYDESKLLTRMPNGTIRYGGPAHTVWNGTEPEQEAGLGGHDRIWASEGDDTIRGNGGDDWMQGGDGVDNLIGGLGDDTLLDSAGDDTLKGGDGNDALSSGQGFGADLNQGGRGNDFIVGGNDMTETFAGPGDDFVFAGDGEDTVFGDDGDDWVEGGRGPFNLLQGDNGAPFQDDLNEPGHDVMMGYGGETDYDAEGGDDIMLSGAGIQRSEGMQGFDWVTHKGDTVPADSDLTFLGGVPPAIETNRDRFDMVEGLSGWNLDDTLRGDDRTATEGEPPILPVDGSPFSGHELTSDGIARIAGLQSILGTGVTSYSGGNILLGGGGSDLIEGRGGDDVIDGDAWLDVQLSATDNTGVTRRVDSMSELQADVFSGRINLSTLSIVRSIKTAAAPSGEDTAVFSEPRANYTITANPDGSTTVAHTGGTGADGVDLVRNVEKLVFAGAVASVPGAPTIGTATGGNASATVTFTAPANDGGSPITEFQVQVLAGTTLVDTVTGIAPEATSANITGLTNGTTYTFRVVALNADGPSSPSAASNPVTPVAPPSPPTIGSASAGVNSATVRWSAPESTGGSAITEYRILVLRNGGQVGSRTVTDPAATQFVVTDLVAGGSYSFRVLAVNAGGASDYSAASNTVVPTAPPVTTTVPGAPGIGRARDGDSGGAVTASVSWSAPTSNGGSPITGYKVTAVGVGDGAVTATSAVQPATARSLVMSLTPGRYRFRVVAVNAIGDSAPSSLSNRVTAR